MKTYLYILIATSLTIVGLFLVSLPSQVQAETAATFTVEVDYDIGDANPGDGICSSVADTCTLRAAIMEANALAGDDTIIIPAGIYHLTTAGSDENGCLTGDLDITGNLTILGDSPATTIIDADGLGDRIFDIRQLANASISNLSVNRGGSDSGAGGGLYNQGVINMTRVDFNLNQSMDGGALYNFDGYASLHQVNFYHNSAWFGGALTTQYGSFSMEDSSVISNTATNLAGGMELLSDTLLDNVIVKENTAPGGGGIVLGDYVLEAHHLILTDNEAIQQGGGFLNYGSANLLDSTISSNHAASGGGIYSEGLVSLSNCTIHGNTAIGDGGGIYNDGFLWIYNNTITSNWAGIISNPAFTGGGIYAEDAGDVHVFNTILHGNHRNLLFPDDSDCYGTITTGHYNLIGSLNGCTLSGDQGLDLVGIDPLLSDLANYGGPTQTQALSLGSPAIDAANPTGCIDPDGLYPTTDQRGHPRPYDGDHDGTPRCDIGAFEFPTSMVYLPITKK